MAISPAGAWPDRHGHRQHVAADRRDGSHHLGLSRGAALSLAPWPGCIGEVIGVGVPPGRTSRWGMRVAALGVLGNADPRVPAERVRNPRRRIDSQPTGWGGGGWPTCPGCGGASQDRSRAPACPGMARPAPPVPSATACASPRCSSASPRSVGSARDRLAMTADGADKVSHAREAIVLLLRHGPRDGVEHMLGNVRAHLF